MTEEPYRWLEAVENRREYVLDQLKAGAPVFAVSLEEGILLLGVGEGRSKVFEIFDRHGMAALGHPADVEKVRQSLIDAAHMEAFTRAPEDVSLRRLVGFGLSPLLKTNFEQLFSAPHLVNTVLAELGSSVEADVLMRLKFDGSFEACRGLAVAAGVPETEKAMTKWLASRLNPAVGFSRAASLCLQSWWLSGQGIDFENGVPDEQTMEAGWRKASSGKVIEAALLRRGLGRAARYEPFTV